MKTKLFQLVLVTFFCAASGTTAFAQSFCLIDDFGETFTLTATWAGGGVYNITGTGYTNTGDNWPCTGSFTLGSGVMYVYAVNPSPDGCTYKVDEVDFRFNYSCDHATVCSMPGGYHQICFGGVIGSFSIGATVYKNQGACGNPNLQAAGSSISKNAANNHTISLAQGDDLLDILNVNEMTINPSVITDNASINLNLNSSGKVMLSVYSLQGKEVKSLVNQSLQSGNYNFTWNGTDNNGTQVEKGLYVITLTTHDNVRTVMVSKN